MSIFLSLVKVAWVHNFIHVYQFCSCAPSERIVAEEPFLTVRRLNTDHPVMRIPAVAPGLWAEPVAIDAALDQPLQLPWSAEAFRPSDGRRSGTFLTPKPLPTIGGAAHLESQKAGHL